MVQISFLTTVYCTSQDANPVLTVFSNPGGSVIVNSSAINNGQSVIVDQGQTQSWVLPFGTNVTLTPTDLSPLIAFSGWGFTAPKTLEICVTSSITIKAAFRAGGSALNDISVAMAQPMRTDDDLLVSFNITNSRAPYTVVKEIYDVTLYLDKIPVPNISWVRIVLESGAIYQLNSLVPITMFKNGNHSLYVLAKTSFLTPNPLPWDPATICDGSGISNMVYYQLQESTTPQPTPPPTNSSENSQPIWTDTTAIIAGVAVAVTVIAITGATVYNFRYTPR
ncbi:MAG: hypothetical protein NWF01_08870 [Candidatus Bathyarchaeota archaeon]|nr:hypothetical protein [Candidatus Bathyarchaeota archaeon]